MKNPQSERPALSIEATQRVETFLTGDPASAVVDVAARLATGAKDDGGKLPVELLPFDALEEVAAVLQFGAKKYARRNWEKGISYSRVLGAVLRHTFKYLQGESLDPETGRSHMAHAACECLFLVAFERRGRTDLDDRTA